MIASITFFILCIVYYISIEPIANKTGLTKFLNKCSNTAFYWTAGAYVYIWILILYLTFFLTKTFL